MLDTTDTVRLLGILMQCQDDFGLSQERQELIEQAQALLRGEL